MGLIQCPECGKEISDCAKRCVNCGYPLKRGSNKKAIIISSIVVAVILIAVTVTLLIVKSNSIIGTWRLDSFIVDGKSVSVDEITDYTHSSRAGFKECNIVFKDDGTFTITIVEADDDMESYDGIYEKEDSRIKATVDGDSKYFDYIDHTISWDISDDIRIVLKK